MELQKIKDICFFLMMAFVFIFGIYVFFYTTTESYDCMVNSGLYTIKNLEKANEANISCSCYVQKEVPIHFTIDNKGISFNEH